VKASKVNEVKRCESSGGQRLRTRAAKLPAASLLNEIARMRKGAGQRPVSSRNAARCARNSVFPAPGPATTQTEPCCRNARHASSSRSSMPRGRSSLLAGRATWSGRRGMVLVLLRWRWRRRKAIRDRGQKGAQFFWRSNRQRLRGLAAEYSNVGAGFASTEKQITIPAQQLLMLRAVKVMATFLAENGGARISPLRWTLSSGLGNLIGCRERL